MLAGFQTGQIALTLALVITATAVALPMWWLRNARAGLRAALLIGQCAVLFAIPWASFGNPVALKVVVALICCGALPPKLVDAALHSAHWHDRPLRHWIGYLINPFIIVHRLHTTAPRGVVAGSPLVIRGLLKSAAGGLILWLAFGYFESGDSFWLEHAVKLIGAYLLVFDGMFVLATGAIRTLGISVLDLTREPALAATPADFWRRYNCEAGRFLREDVFYPLGGRRHPAAAGLLVFFINGVLHEYLALILVGHVTGYQLAFFALHGVATALTVRLRPRSRFRLVGMLLTLIFLFFTTILFFATVNLFWLWYSHTP
jgi:hypothetical protein